MSARQAAAAMGIGRFVYTPILPLMTAQAGLSAASAASLATANYLGYFVGAVATIIRAPSRTTNRLALVLLVATLAGMPLTHSMTAWFVLRLLAGVASALVFVTAVNARPGWSMSGVGAGIALSGLIVLVHAPVAVRLVGGRRAVGPARALGLATATGEAATAGHRIPATRIRRPLHRLHARRHRLHHRRHVPGRRDQRTARQQRLGARRPLRRPLPRADQAGPARAAGSDRPAGRGIALPALVGGTPAVLIAVVLFGGTFPGIVATALKIGADLGFPRAAAVLTTGYSAGQVLGPLIATPLLHNGYHQALLAAAAIVLLAAVTAPAPLSRHRAAARKPPRRTPAELVE
ncbi:YbfB/YjiJ family MFS transporter [Lentzea indica]|uniref:YbfB/YjiJ family MFS transporter n=1 Tax=Lentzea indica TaxID=2604800 RepID=UPI001CB6E49F|nr:YbfB/YjiJ family MFS transporter [Lentzea indica]